MNPMLIERLQTFGYRAASPIDLIAAGFSRRAEDVSEEMARDLLRSLGKIQRLAEISPSEVHLHTGLEGFELIRALSLLELGRRSANAGRGEAVEMGSPEAISELFEYLQFERKEHFCVALLDVKNQLIKRSTIHIGTINASLVGPREVFREAIREGAASMVVVHNHPSGDPTPSPEDLEVTQRLVEIGDLMDLPVLDHVIIGDRRFRSLRRMGLMQ